MADQEFFNAKFSIEMQTLEINLKTAVGKTALTIDDFIQRLALANVSQAEIKRLLLDDLKTGGRIFGEFRNSVKATTEGTIGKISTDAYLSEFGTDIDFTWIAALVRTCADCLPRHGQIKKFDKWENLGLPRTGWSVCRDHCQCVLIPKEMSEGRSELTEPLRRQPRTRR